MHETAGKYSSEKSHFIQNRKKSLRIKEKTETAPVPKNALIELTNSCNHSCVFCFNPEMKRKTSHIDIEVFENFITKAAKEGLEEVGLYSTGEPFMTKNLDQYILLSKKAGIKRVYITTNGALASLDKVIKCIESGLDSIKFSINAATKEKYKITHGHDDFEKVIKNLNDIYDYKNKNKIKLKILCTFVYTDLTYPEINFFKKKYGHYFSDLGFYKAKNQGGRTLDKVKSMTKNATKNNPEEKKQNDGKIQPCEMLWNRLHLTSEGYLTACCVDYENDLVYKKFTKDQSILDQFNSEKMKNLRTLHLNNNLDGTICKGCIYNTNENYKKLDKNIDNVQMKIQSKKINSLSERVNIIKNT